jgi:hypothetical protein
MTNRVRLSPLDASWFDTGDGKRHRSGEFSGKLKVLKSPFRRVKQVPLPEPD